MKFTPKLLESVASAHSEIQAGLARYDSAGNPETQRRIAIEELTPLGRANEQLFSEVASQFVEETVETICVALRPLIPSEEERKRLVEGITCISSIKQDIGLVRGSWGHHENARTAVGRMARTFAYVLAAHKAA